MGRVSWLRTVVTWLLAAVAVLPFAFAVWMAEKPRDRVDGSYHYLVASKKLPEAEVRRKIEIDPRPLRVSLTNTVVVCTASTVLCVVLASMAGYAFAKKQFAGKATLFDLVLASMALPAAILMMPLFRVTAMLRIYDTLAAVILPFGVTGFGIFYMRYAMSAVPDDLVDAALVDGLSEPGALFRVVLPAIWPSVLTLAALQFIGVWGAFVIPQAVLESPEHYTIGVLLGRLMTDYRGLMWNDVMVVVLASILPVMILFVVLERWVLPGLRAIGEERGT
ncbi:MAG: carbohydrate ABC transporter permease [Planctomycetota bacterium]